MLKFIKFFLFFFILNLILPFAEANIKIVTQIEDEIITNQDVETEKNYLEILNPNLNQLNQSQVYDLAKNSLINEIIKKKEIEKFLDLNKKHSLTDDYLKNLYLRLGFTNENQFKTELSKKNNYSLEEIESKIQIELLWNELIFLKYNNQISIDENKLKNKIQSLNNQYKEEYLLSEILISIDKKENIKKNLDQIELSINEIGFSNTANIYSISDSSKLGGNLGWVNKNQLSNSLIKEIENLKVGDYTKPIRIGNNYLIIKKEDLRKSEIEIDQENEFKKLIQNENDRQLNQFSRIYFNKSKKNYFISEK
jgi:peptidyl-prolyl cis-trans isomerase SurA